MLVFRTDPQTGKQFLERDGKTYALNAARDHFGVDGSDVLAGAIKKRTSTVSGTDGHVGLEQFLAFHRTFC